MKPLLKTHPVVTRPETQIGDMVAAGPWAPALRDILLSCVLNSAVPLAQPDRRKPVQAETLTFEATDLALTAGALDLAILIAHDQKGAFLGRRKRSFWIFGRIDAGADHCPISRHETLNAAVQTMMDIFKAITVAQATAPGDATR